MESQGKRHFWKRRAFNRMLAFVLAMVMVCGSVPDHMMNVRAESSSAQGGIVSDGDNDLQNSGGGGTQGYSVSLLDDSASTATQIAIEPIHQTVIWNGTSPRSFSVDELFKVTGYDFGAMIYDDHYTTEIVWESTTSVTKSVDGVSVDGSSAKYTEDNRRWSFVPVSSGVITVRLNVKDSEALNLIGATAETTVTIQKGNVTSLSGNYYLQFGRFAAAEYNSGFQEKDIRLYTNQGELCDPEKMTITYTYKDEKGNPVTGFPTEIGTYKVKASVTNNPLWEDFSVESSFRIVPRVLYVDVKTVADSYQYGLVDTEDNEIAIAYGTATYTNADAIKEGDVINLTFTTDATKESEPGNHKIYVSGDNKNYTIHTNRSEETGVGYVKIVPREITAEWNALDTYVRTYTGSEIYVGADLKNHLSGDIGVDKEGNEKLYITYTGNSAVNPNVEEGDAPYVAEITGIAGSKAHCYNFTIPAQATQNWRIDYAPLQEGVTIGPVVVKGDTIYGDWFSGEVSLIAPEGYTITLNKDFTGFAESILLTDATAPVLREDVDNKLTVFIKDSAGKIVGSEKITIKYDNTNPDILSLLFKGINFDKESDLSANTNFFFTKGDEKEFTYTVSDETGHVAGVYKVEYAIASPDTDFSTTENAVPWKVLYQVAANGTTSGSISDTVAMLTSADTALAEKVNCGFGVQRVYLKVTDLAGNATIISTDDIVVYEDATVKYMTEDEEDGQVSTKDYHAEYVVAEKEDVTINLQNVDSDFFAAGYITEVTMGGVPVATENYGYAGGALTIKSAAFEAVTNVPINGYYNVAVTVKPYGVAYNDKYADGATVNDAPVAVAIKVLAKKANVDITMDGELTANYDGVAYDSVSFTSTEGVTAPTYYYALKTAIGDVAYDNYAAWETGMPKDAGTYVVKVLFDFVDATSLYNDAVTYVELTIDPLPVTATLVVEDKTYDKTHDATVTGLVIDYGEASLPAGVELKIDPTTVIGSFRYNTAGENISVRYNGGRTAVLDGSDKLSNYAVSFVDGQADILKAPLTITIGKEGLKFSYGNTPYFGAEAQITVLGLKGTGDKQDKFVVDESGIYTENHAGISFGMAHMYEDTANRAGKTIGDAYEPGDPTGMYQITASCTNSNYMVASVNGQAEIKRRQLTLVSASGLDIYYDGKEHTKSPSAGNVATCDKDNPERLKVLYAGELSGTEPDDYTYWMSGIEGTQADYYAIATETTTWTIKSYVYEPEEDFEDGGEEGENGICEYGWYNFKDANSYSIPAPSGHKIKIYKAGEEAAAEWLDNYPISKGTIADGVHDYVRRYKNTSTGTITQAETIKIKVDTTAPTGTIKVTDKTNSKSFTTRVWNAVKSIFFKDSAFFTIDDVVDNASGLPTSGAVKYVVLDKLYEDLTNEELDELVWETYEDEVTISASQIAYVYAKFVDVAGNTVIISTDGVVVYKDSSVTYTAENPAEYTKYSGNEVAVAYTFNGNTVKSVAIMSGSTKVMDVTQYTLTGESIIFGSVLDALATDASVDFTDYTIAITMNPMGVTMPEEYTGVAPAVVEVPLRVTKAVAEFNDIAFDRGEAATINQYTGVSAAVSDFTYTTTHKAGEQLGTVSAKFYAYDAAVQDNVGAEIAAPKDAGKYFVELSMPATENYLAVTSDKVLFEILPKDVEGTITIEDKVYDTTADAVIADATVDTGIAGETLTLDKARSTAAFVFADVNVDDDIAVSLDATVEDNTYSKLVYTGANINNYKVAYTVGTADITKRTVYAYIDGITATYGDAISVEKDDLEITDVTEFYTVADTGIVDANTILDDVLSEISYAEEAGRMVGTYVIPLTGFEVENGNYKLVLKDSKTAAGNDASGVVLEITKRPITPVWKVTNAGLADEECAAPYYYNAENYVVSLAKFDNVIEGDDVTASVGGEYSCKDVNAANDDDGYIATLGELSNGNYTYAKDAQDNELRTFEWSIEYLPDEIAPELVVSGTAGVDDWYRSYITLAADGEGCKIALVTGGAEPVWEDSITIEEEGWISEEYVLKTQKGYITEPDTFESGIDMHVPGAEIEVTYDVNASKSFVNKVLETLSFGIFTTKDVTVEITAVKEHSAVAAQVLQSDVYDTLYALADDDVAVDDELLSKLEWTEYDSTKPIKISSKTKKIVLVKVVDKAGNVGIYNADGVVVYTNSTATIPVVNENTANEFVGYDIERVNAGAITIDVALNGNTLAGVSCDGEALTETTDYIFDATTGKLTLLKSFVTSLCADNTSTPEDEGKHALTISFHALGEVFTDTSVGTTPSDVVFFIKMNKAEGIVTLDDTYATSNIYDGAFVDVPRVVFSTSSGVPQYEFKKNEEGAVYGSSRPKNVGEYVVKVTVPEDDYYMAKSEELEFTVVPKELTVNIPVNSKTYDGNVSAGIGANLTVDTGITGEEIIVTKGSRFAAEFENKNVGENKSINVTNADVDFEPANDNTDLDNYSFVFAAGSAAILPKEISVVVKRATAVYGDALPNFELESATGLVSGEGLADIGEITFVADAQVGDDADTYNVSYDAEAFAELNSNYKIVRFDGTDALEILPRELTVTWPAEADRTLLYNGMAQTITATLSGALSGDEVVLAYSSDSYGTTVGNGYAATITKLTGDDADNYVLASGTTMSKGFTIVYPTVSDSATVTDKAGNAVVGWYNGDVVIVPPTGYDIATSNTSADTGWMTSLECTRETTSANDTQYEYYLKSKADGTISDVMYVDVKIDKTAPGGKITIEENNVFESIINAITFGMFYERQAEVVITTDESLSGIAKIEFMFAESYEDYQSKKADAANWTVVTGVDRYSYDITEVIKGAVFARITDGAGNVKEVNSNGVVVYENASLVDTTATFMKATEDVVVVQAQLNRNTIKSVVIGRETLDEGDDYEVVEDTAEEGYHKITLKNSYLKNLDAGEYTVVINYNPLGSEFLPGVANGDAPAPTNIALSVVKNNTLTEEEMIQVTGLSNLVYNGKPVDPEVTRVSTGAVTITYYDEDGNALNSVPENAGDYVAVVKVDADDNYVAYELEVPFSIDKKDITATVVSATSIYGEAVPAFTATVDERELGVGDNYSDLGITLVAKKNGVAVTSTSGVGTYNVYGECSNGNYEVDIVGTGKYVVTSRPLVVTWSDGEFTYDAREKSVVPTVLSRVGLDDVAITYSGNVETEVGNYTATITAVGNSNYTMTGATGLSYPWSISYAEFPEDVKVTVSPALPESGYYTEDVVLTVPDGYSLSIGNDPYVWKKRIEITEDGEHDMVCYIQKDSDKTIAEGEELAIAIDTEAPKIVIKVKDNEIKSLINEITFGMFCKESVDITVEAVDDVSGVKTYEYQIVKEGKACVETGWKKGSEISISKDATVVVYARVTDNAGNYDVLWTNGIVVYGDSVLNTNSISYTKASGKEAVANVRFSSNTVNTIVNGGKELIKDTDYEVDYATGDITFAASYLETLGEGNYTLTISYKPLDKIYVAADGNDAPLTSTLALTVVKGQSIATEDVTAEDFAKTYDGNVVTAPTFDETGMGQKVIVEYKVKDADDSTYTTTAPKDAGDYTVRLTAKENDYYEEKVTTIDFTIDPVAVTVKVTPVEVAYGDEMPELKATVSSTTPLVGEDDYDDLGITLVVKKGSQVITGITGVGTYDVELEAAENKNYAVTVDGEDSFVVEPCVVEIQWPSAEVVYNGTAQTITPVVKNAVSGEDCKIVVIGNTGTVVDDYKAEVVAVGNANYTLEGATNTVFDWSIVYGQIPDDVNVTIDAAQPILGYYTEDVVIVAPEGYDISTKPDGTEDEWADELTVSEEGEQEVTYYLQKEVDGTVYGPETITLKLDTKAPVVTIKVKENKFKEVINTITFGLFFKETVDVEITAVDNASGIATYEYQVVNEGKELTEDGWKSGSKVSIVKNAAVVVYARVTDKVGHEIVRRTNGMVVYGDSVLDTNELVYTKKSGSAVVANVSFNGNTINEIKVGNSVLTETVNYTVDYTAGSITFKTTALDELPLGENTVTISYRPLDKSYVEADGNEAPAVSTFKLTVKKAESVVLKDVTSEDFAKDYDGADVTAPDFEDGQKVTVEYKVKDADDSTYTTEAPDTAGDYTVRITAEENEEYTKKVVEIDFTIAKRAITVKADDQTVLVGRDIASDKYSVSVGALVTGHSISTVTLTADTSVVTESGKITISNVAIADANGKDVSANYQITCAEGTLVVKRDENIDEAEITITLGKVGHEVGETINPEEIEIKVEYTDGHVELITEFETNIDEIDMSTPGIKVVEITYILDGVERTEEILIDVTSDQGSVGFEIIKDEEVPELTLQNNVEDVKNDVLTDTEKEAVNAGASFNIYLELDEDVATNDKDLVKAALGKLAVGQFMDISLYKKISDGEVIAIHEVNKKLQLTVEIPEELILDSKTVTRTYQVVRVHEGQVEWLATTHNKANQTLTFETDRFSTYAILYVDTYVSVDSGNQNTPEDGNVSDGSGDGTTSADDANKSPKTGDDTIPFVGMLSLITLLGAMMIYKKTYAEKENK